MKSFIALLLLSFIAITLCQSPVAAPSQLGDGRARTLKFFEAPGSIGVKAVAVTKVGGMTELDAILAGATLIPFPTMAFSYYTSERNVTEDITTFTSGRFSFAFRFAGIVEYKESGANAGYQRDEDTHVSYYSFRKDLVGWQDTSSSEVNNNGQTVRVATASTKDGVATFTFVFAGDRTIYENKTLNGDNFKFSLMINYGNAPNYSGRNDTSIAIVTIAASKQTVKDIQRIDDDANGIEVPSGEKAIVGSLNWDSQVTGTRGDKKGFYNLVSTVDDTLRNDTVAINVTSSWTSKVVYHSISLEGNMSIGNTQLYWDPELGADIDYNALGSASSASSIIVSISVVISAIVALMA